MVRFLIAATISVSSVQAFAQGFVAGTSVRVGSSEVSVEDVKVGHQVLSCNSEGCEVSGEVTEVFESQEEVLEILMTYPRGQGFRTPNVVFASASQKFLTEDDEFVKACDLQVGSVLVGENQVQFTVESIDSLGVEKVYTFEVEPEHTYFAEGLVVHNPGPNPASTAAGQVTSNPVTGTHQCQSSTSIGHTCTTHSVGVDKASSNAHNMQNDCCPHTAHGGSSIGFSVSGGCSIM